MAENLEGAGDDDEDGGLFNTEWMFNNDIDRATTAVPGDEDEKRGESNLALDKDEPPKYLMAAILSGVYELPPLYLMKTMTGRVAVAF